MSRGEHAADDGSFGRSAGGAMARGVALIVVAVVLGIFLLKATDGPDSFDAGAGPVGGADDTTTTTAGTGDDGDGPTTTLTPPPPDVDPSAVTVLVANGASVSGFAGDLTELVAAEGFETADATDVEEDVETSTVYFTPTFEEAAEAVAAVFDPVPEVAALPDPSPVDDLAGADVVLVAGLDLVPE